MVYPAMGLTKRQLAAYYEAVADQMVPHVAGRPLTLVRCPRGQGGPCFVQKHAGGQFPEQVRELRVSGGPSGEVDYPMVETAAGLVSLVQMGTLEVHAWVARTPHLDRGPDRLVFDLDPDEGLPWARVAAAARVVRDELEGLGLRSFVKTTGGKGLHVVVPVEGAPWDDALAFSRRVAEGLAAERPGEFTAHMAKAERGGKVFIDYLRNARGSIVVAPYSTRAKPGAPVSMPLAWEALGRAKPEAWSAERVLARLAESRGGGPWAGWAEASGQRLPALPRPRAKRAR
ncbi:MAG TPA: non-homologous end-joining DNA ligase [Polyangiaceae bacterium]|nr:non-homologous end-joining DNA ligase [Polyangiaceae bacterium]